MVGEGLLFLLTLRLSIVNIVHIVMAVSTFVLMIGELMIGELSQYLNGYARKQLFRMLQRFNLSLNI